MIQKINQIATLPFNVVPIADGYTGLTGGAHASFVISYKNAGMATLSLGSLNLIEFGSGNYGAVFSAAQIGTVAGYFIYNVLGTIGTLPMAPFSGAELLTTYDFSDLFIAGGTVGLAVKVNSGTIDYVTKAGTVTETATTIFSINTGTNQLTTRVGSVAELATAIFAINTGTNLLTNRVGTVAEVATTIFGVNTGTNQLTTKVATVVEVATVIFVINNGTTSVISNVTNIASSIFTASLNPYASRGNFAGYIRNISDYIFGKAIAGSTAGTGTIAVYSVESGLQVGSYFITGSGSDRTKTIFSLWS